MDNVFSLRDRVLSELRCYTAPSLALAADLGILGPRSPRLENHQQRGSDVPRVWKKSMKCIYTIWLFNIAMENHHAIISMGHLYHGYVK